MQSRDLVPGGATGIFGDRETERWRRIAQGLVDAGVALSSMRHLEEILQRLADLARELVDARYAALGVINPERTGLSEFITSGLSEEERERLGRLPMGHGILGLLITDARPIRLRDLREHPSSAGFPAHHPEMRSFLGVPVGMKDEIFGNLYVTEKRGAAAFDEDDLMILEMLAAQAAVAIENARFRRERERFFASAGHELGNMISSIKLWARQLTRRPPAEVEEWQRGVGHIRKGADRAGRIIDDIMSLSRMGEGRIRIDAVDFDLMDLLKELVDQNRHTAEAVGLRIELEAPDGPLMIESDRTRIWQIVANLINNSLKFTPAGGSIEVGVERTDPGMVSVSVKDTGPGIAPEDQKRIFEPYEQVVGVARGTGNGLGLSLSRHLALSLGGDLGVESVPGEGATFTLRLPLERRRNDHPDGRAEAPVA